MKLYSIEIRHADSNVTYLEGLTLSDILGLVGGIDNFDGPVVTIIEMI